MPFAVVSPDVSPARTDQPASFASEKYTDRPGYVRTCDDPSPHSERFCNSLAPSRSSSSPCVIARPASPKRRSFVVMSSTARTSAFASSTTGRRFPAGRPAGSGDAGVTVAVGEDVAVGEADGSSDEQPVPMSAAASSAAASCFTR